MEKCFPSEKSFSFMRNVSISKINELKRAEIISLLPSLLRMSQCPSIDVSLNWNEARREIQRVLCDLEIVNNVVALLSVDFGCLRQDCLKEQQLQRKLESTGNTAVVEQSKKNLALEFERSEPIKRLRLVLGEILRIINKAVENPSFTSYESCELFESDVYLMDVCHILTLAQAELSGIFQMTMMVQGLLRVHNGPWFICNLVVNSPDYFEQVCSLLLNDSKQDNVFQSDIQTTTLHHLCQMKPDYALSMRSEAVHKCCLPELAIKLTLDFLPNTKKDLVDFLTGLLLGNNLHVRRWLAQFIKTEQKTLNGDNALKQLREELLSEVIALTPKGHRYNIRNEWKIQQSGNEKQRITVDEHDEETLEIIQAMDVSTDFEIVKESQPTSRSEKDDLDMMMNVESKEVQLDKEKVIYATALLRLYCALKGIAGMKLTENEADELLCLITSEAPYTAAGVRFIIVGLCTILACSYITSTNEREKVIVKWIERLCEEEENYEIVSCQHDSFGERLLLTAIHFHSNNLEAINDLVSSTLGMRVRPGMLTRIKTIFTQELFPEKATTEHAVRVSVTPQLNNSHVGFLPIHCVYHLLKNRAFTKHSIPVKTWLYNQLLNSCVPLHPLLVNLIDVYVTAVVMPLPSKHRKPGVVATVEGFSEHDIQSVFNNQSDHTRESSLLTAQLLLLYYLLNYKDCCLTNMKSLVSNNNRPMEYSPVLYSQIPIKYLLQRAKQDENNYRDLYPPLLRMLVTYYPQLCLVEDWICEEDMKTFSNVQQSSNNIISVNDVAKALSDIHVNSPKAILTLLKLNQIAPEMLIAHTDIIVESLAKAMQANTSRRVLSLLHDLWMKLNTMIPRRLWLVTVNTLCCPNNGQMLVKTLYNDDEITKDPLTVLRCHRNVFRSAPILAILLRVLMGYLAASRALLNQHILANVTSTTKPTSTGTSGSGGGNTEQEREELKVALLAAQESAVVQILLEICLPTVEEKNKQMGSMWKCELREIQCLVCSTLHQMFISEPKLVKLIHFQGYNPDLLPITVSGIPSMHICLDFITELLNQPPLEKQLFAVQLSSFLCIQYPLPKALDVVKSVLNRLLLLAEALSAEKCAQFFMPASQCLIRYCQAFPPLCMDISSLLILIGRTTASRAAGTCGQDIDLFQSHGLLERSATKGSVDQLEDLGFEDSAFFLKDDAVFVAGSQEVALYNTVKTTFKQLINLGLLQRYGLSNR